MGLIHIKGHRRGLVEEESLSGRETRRGNGRGAKDFIYIYENVLACIRICETVFPSLCIINTCCQNSQQHLCVCGATLDRIHSWMIPNCKLHNIFVNYAANRSSSFIVFLENTGITILTAVTGPHPHRTAGLNSTRLPQELRFLNPLAMSCGFSAAGM